MSFLPGAVDLRDAGIWMSHGSGEYRWLVTLYAEDGTEISHEDWTWPTDNLVRLRALSEREGRPVGYVRIEPFFVSDRVRRG